MMPWSAPGQGGVADSDHLSAVLRERQRVPHHGQPELRATLNGAVLTVEPS